MKYPEVLFCSAPVEFQAAADDDTGGLRKFSMVAYTGGLMRLSRWMPPVVIDLKGMKVTRKPRPILRDHNPAQIVGHTTEVKTTVQI